MKQIDELLIKYQMLIISIRRLNECYIYNKIAKIEHIQEKKVISKLENADKDIAAYNDNLTEYINNHSKYEADMGQDKFFMNAIIEIRDLAEQGFKCLVNMSKNTKDQNEKTYIEDLIVNLKTTTNFLLRLVRTILENDEKFQNLMNSHNINCIKKYNLEYFE